MRLDRSNNNCRVPTLIDSLISGCVSSASTTVIYQPLELLKTRIQIQTREAPSRIFGRTTRNATQIIRNHNVVHLWRGTGASLIRSVPGVGLYYASLNILQTNFSGQRDRPDSPTQAFYFGLSARSIVSFLLLPVTVVKVRYESGQYKYTSLNNALKDAYLRTGWVGIAPTIIRDSLFSGVYYMCYTKLKTIRQIGAPDKPVNSKLSDRTLNFLSGLLSGMIAAFVTNPVDVIKTHMQVGTSRSKSMLETTTRIVKGHNGLSRLFDGLVPRSLRRTLIAASTWTFYEMMIDILQDSN